jgi:hypothetical protein
MGPGTAKHQRATGFPAAVACLLEQLYRVSEMPGCGQVLRAARSSGPGPDLQHTIATGQECTRGEGIIVCCVSGLEQAQGNSTNSTAEDSETSLPTYSQKKLSRRFGGVPLRIWKQAPTPWYS